MFYQYLIRQPWNWRTCLECKGRGRRVGGGRGRSRRRGGGGRVGGGGGGRGLSSIWIEENPLLAGSDYRKCVERSLNPKNKTEAVRLRQQVWKCYLWMCFPNNKHGSNIPVSYWLVRNIRLWLVRQTCRWLVTKIHLWLEKKPATNWSEKPPHSGW